MSRPNHTLNLVLAILTTLCCCPPLGIVAIIFAAIGMSREGAGDYVGAASAARTARILNWISMALGLVIIAIYILFFVLLGIAALPFLDGDF